MEHCVNDVALLLPAHTRLKAAFQNRLQTETALEQMVESESVTSEQAVAASEIRKQQFD
jgi:hypothetical protein